MTQQLTGLDIGMESTSVETANQRLEKFAPNVAKAERATDDLNASTRQSSSALLQMVASIERAIREQNEFIRGMAEGAAAATREAVAMNDLGRATSQMAATTQKSAEIIDLAQRRATMAHTRGAAGAKLQAHEVTNLGRQFADIGVMLGSGQNPFMTLLQQGPQIADIFHTASLRGIGFKAVLAEIGVMAAPIVAILAPFAIAAGAVAAGLGLMHRELAKGYPKHITDGLGLTAEQLKRVKDRSVDFGDTFMATVTVVGRHLKDGPIGDALDWLGKRFTEVMDAIAKAALYGTAGIVAAFTGTYEAIRQTWRSLPAVFADLTISAANMTLRALEDMTNRAVAGLNKLIAMANGAAAKVGISERLGTIGPVDWGQIANANAGAAAKAGDVTGKAYVDAFESALKTMRALGVEIGAEALKRARDQALKQAGDAAKASNKETDATRALRDAMEDLLRTRRAGLAIENQYNKVRAGMPSNDNLANAEAVQTAAQAKKDQKQWDEDLLAAKRQRMDLARSYAERLRLSREMEQLQKGEVQDQGPFRKAVEEVEASYRDLNDNLRKAAGAINAGDWGSAVTGLFTAFEGLRQAMKSGTGRLGAIAGVADVAGQAVGGPGGSALSGAASGALAGAAFGPLGALAGGLIGGIGGFMSGSKKKDEERQRQREAEAQRVQAIADQHRQLEIAIMEASGDAVGALAARRADELKGVDASNRALAEQLYAAQDAAEAQAKAAEAARAVAEAEKQLADQRHSLDIQMLEATGNAVAALAMRRQDELLAMDASLRSLQSAVWAAQDMKAANDNLASSLASLADLQQQAAMQAQQAQVNALQVAAQAAQAELDAANTRLDAAHATLSAAYDKEAGALKGVIDGMSAFAKTIREFRAQMAAEATGSSYGASKAAFYTAAAAGPSGDASALVGSAQAFLEQSKSNARTLLDFQRDKAAVDSALALAEAAAGAQVDVGQAQLDALNKQVDGLLTVNASVVSVHDAIAQLAVATAAQAIALSASNGASGNAQAAASALAAAQASQQAAQQQAALDAAQKAVNDNAAAGGVNWASYLTHYKDVAGAYSSDPNAQAAGRSMEEWAKFHYDAVGKNEGRTPYAMGGAFSGAVGDILSQETHVGAGRVGGEAGPEAIMPLERGPDGKLGVRAGGNDNSDVVDALRTIQGQLAASQAETRQLRVQLVALKDEVAKVTANTGKAAIDTANINKTLTNVTHGGEAMQVQDAA